MSFTLEIPTVAGSLLRVPLSIGEVLFVLGANGTGKSSLMHSFYKANTNVTRQISAHRQNWFQGESINLSPQRRLDLEKNIKSGDEQEYSRWRDDFSAARGDIALFDLVRAQNNRARKVTKAVDDKDIDQARALAQAPSPLKVINELLRLSNLPIELTIQEDDQIVATRHNSTPYSVARLSDGERNALLIAANILTAPEGTLILVDEPERHLHRSIISPLLTLLFAKRPDCAFVVSTHDVMLPLDNPVAKTLLLRSSVFSGQVASAWDADLVISLTELSEEVQFDILGSRRKILFVEGREHSNSLDKPLYSILFPEVSVVSKTSCRDVEQAVLGIRGAEGLHWVKAFGIIDNDGRTQEDVDNLRIKGVYALPVFSVESIYYHPFVQGKIAERAEAAFGGSSVDRLKEGAELAIRAIREQALHLCSRVVEKRIREEIFKSLPRQREIKEGREVAISIDVNAKLNEEREVLENAVSSSNLDLLISRYPIRETAALDKIFSSLGFRTRTEYEGAVRKLILDDAAAASFVRNLFGTLSEDIARV